MYRSRLWTTSVDDTSYRDPFLSCSTTLCLVHFIILKLNFTLDKMQSISKIKSTMVQNAVQKFDGIL